MDIRDTEPLRGDTHGITYAVQAVTQPQSAGPGSDLELQLLQVT